MQTSRWLLASIVGALIVVLAPADRSGLLAQSASSVRATDPTALTGVVSSVEEGPMEGVLVSVRHAGAARTTTVVSDAQGRYRFPRARLDPGSYTVAIRAIGYDLATATVASVARS